MDSFEHLRLIPLSSEIPRKKTGFSTITEVEGRNKKDYYDSSIKITNQLKTSIDDLKKKFNHSIDPNLIFKLNLNQSIDSNTLIQNLKGMNINCLNVFDNKKGYWIVFSEDEELISFKDKLAQYSEISKGHKYSFFNAIESIEDISPEEKIGELLKVNPISETDKEYLNIELWRMDKNKIDKFLDELGNLFDNENFRILDRLVTNSFALFRVRITKEVFEQILPFKEIAKVDRPFSNKFNPFEYKNIDISEIGISKPEDNSRGILIIDSGIISNHPLLKEAVGHEENFQDGEPELQDVTGHGTAVAGNCIYGDIEKCIDQKNFSPSNFIFSAKVMYAEKFGNEIIGSIYDKEKLLENQFKDSIELFLNNEEYRIKVVNISFGNDNEIWKGNFKNQFPLASLIDELALEYPRVVFVVSTGNCDPKRQFSSLNDIINNYPDCICDNPEYKIINPATSSLSLTIGSIAPELKTFERYDDEIWHPIANENEPSPFTRSGSGVNGAIKPELVEYGGNCILKEQAGIILTNVGSKITLISNKTTEESFRFDYGTSFCAPKISHLCGKIGNLFPDSTSNFIKNLVLQSSYYPKNIETIFSGSITENRKKVLNTIGYGLPDFENSINSYKNRVLLFDEGEIGLNNVKCYSLNLPDIFNNTGGKKEIVVILTYNPITRSTRGDSYFGNVLEFRLFHKLSSEIILEQNSNVEEIKDESEESAEEEDENILLEARCDLKLIPLSSLRKSTCHQKATISLPRKKIVNPLSLILFNKNKWIKEEDYKQSYCISLLIKHNAEIDLYNHIKNQVRVRVRS